MISKVSIDVDAVGHGRIAVGEHDLSKAVRSFTITGRAQRLTTVELEVGAFVVGELGEADVRLLLAPGVHEALVALGWTPPPTST